MTAAFFLVEPGELGQRPGDTVVISGPEGRHAATVRRLSIGEQILVGDGRGRVVEGVVSAVLGPDRVDVEVTSYAEYAPPAPRVVVVQALAKGDRGERAGDDPQAAARDDEECLPRHERSLPRGAGRRQCGPERAVRAALWGTGR